MDYDSIQADRFGRTLRGIGVNLLTKDVLKEADFVTQCLGFKAFQLSKDFAIIQGCGNVFMLHHDDTYSGHAIISTLPEAGPRGGGIELRAYGSDPDDAARKAEEAGGMVLAAPKDSHPHGLREAFILSPSGYVWVPSQEI